MSWILAQLGAREHYAIARALDARGRLTRLVTEAWIHPGSGWARISRRFAQRFHPDLVSVRVVTWNARSVAFELAAKVKRRCGWPLILDRMDLSLGTSVHFDRVPNAREIHDLDGVLGLQHLVISLPGWPTDVQVIEPLTQLSPETDAIFILH